MKTAKAQGSKSKKSAPDSKTSTRKSARKASGHSRSKMMVTNPNASGIDIGSQTHFVAVPAGRDAETVRSFSAFSGGLDAMVEWLKACEITTVAMESTGVYWIPVYQRLEEAGFEVMLVDARSVKHVPGRKTDVKDCQWIQQLHTYGLLRAAFRPEDEICRLRTLQRHRKNLVESSAMRIQHMEKALNEQNLHLHHVLRDITGVSGLRILDAILEGNRDPKALANLADKRVKKSTKEIEAALTGNYRDELLFVLGQSLEAYRHEQAQIAQCDEAILKQLDLMNSVQTTIEVKLPTQVEEVAGKKKAPKSKVANPQTETANQMVEQLHRIIGVDLTLIPGFGLLAVLTLLSEIGLDMGRWRNEKAFTSWLGLCPNHKISGGKVLGSQTRKVINRAATVFRMAAMAIGKTQTPLGSFYRRKRAQLGAPKANTATARKLACLVYRLMKSQQAYQQEDVRTYELKFKDQMIRSLRKRATSLGYDIIECADVALAA